MLLKNTDDWIISVLLLRKSSIAIHQQTKLSNKNHDLNSLFY